MKKTRIHGGFSLVEMMLLLLITSLMLASGVTVISKKHVKVPKIAMHGAYMCYYKNGVLHEEKYVGAGLRKKILDRDVTECRFQPPERSSYMHIQAIGGGGGGGDSGYQGGNLQRFESATEVIQPFGITENLLQLKGIHSNELQNLGGTLYAYANASGKLGDAGDGGNLYYIKEDCGDGDDCLVHRKWWYTGTSEKMCDCDYNKGDVEYTKKVWYYEYTCYPSCTGTDCDRCEKYDTESCTGTGCYHCYRYKKEKCTSDCTDDECSTWNYSYYDDDGKWVGKHKTTCKSGTRTTDHCEDGYDYTNYCLKGYNIETCHDKTCEDIHDEPYDATCSVTDERMLTVKTEDTFAENTGKNPPFRIKTKDPQLTEDTAYLERIVVRDANESDGNEYSICNYGNPTKFTGVKDGIFGSFVEDGKEVVGVNCTTAEIMNAFGDEIFPLGKGKTTKPSVVEKSASSVYDNLSTTKQARFPYYDQTETLGLDAAYGTSCVNTYNGNCETSTKNNAKYTNPMDGAVYKTEKPLYTDCEFNPKNGKYSTDDSLGCADKVKHELKSSTKLKKNVAKSCRCVQANPKSSGTECMYNYDQVTDKSKRCQYIPVVANGGKAGKGTQCRTTEVNAGLNLHYVGNSSVVPGIRGSDINCTGAGFKPLYTEAQWKSQPRCYAENGSDSQGSARVELGGNWCEANVRAPGKAQGAGKITTGVPTSESIREGQDAPYIDNSGKPDQNNGNVDGTVSGIGYTRAGGCGANHVGYCLQAGGNNSAVRENGKYTYKYTWNTNYLQYGEGGKAGSYRTMIVRSFKDRDILITVGRGGAGGAEGTGAAGDNGGDTIVGDILTAEGGAGGPGGKVTPTEQLPYWFQWPDPDAFKKGANGTPGEVPNRDNFKANIMNLILPSEMAETNDVIGILNSWINASGIGGNGGGSTNNCWASEWERWFEGRQLSEATNGLKLDAADLETHGCRKGQYWSATPVATDGTPGAVLIKW